MNASGAPAHPVTDDLTYRVSSVAMDAPMETMALLLRLHPTYGRGRVE